MTEKLELRLRLLNLHEINCRNTILFGHPLTLSGVYEDEIRHSVKKKYKKRGLKNNT